MKDILSTTLPDAVLEQALINHHGLPVRGCAESGCEMVLSVLDEWRYAFAQAVRRSVHSLNNVRMKQPKAGRPELSASEVQLLTQLRQQPELMTQLQSLVELTRKAEGPLKTADAVVRLRVGSRAGSVWAQPDPDPELPASLAGAFGG